MASRRFMRATSWELRSTSLENHRFFATKTQRHQVIQVQIAFLVPSCLCGKPAFSHSHTAGSAHVSFEIEMLGNFDEKSFARCAIFTATWRATLLYRPAISPSGSLTTLGRPLSA